MPNETEELEPETDEAAIATVIRLIEREDDLAKRAKCVKTAHVILGRVVAGGIETEWGDPVIAPTVTHRA